MAEYTAVAAQTVALNQNILLTEEPVGGNCSIIHREGSGLVTLRGITRQCRSRFRVFFSGNIAISTGGTVGPISLAIAANGEAVNSSEMTVTPAAIGEYFNVAGGIFLDVPAGCCTQISVKNTSISSIDVKNVNLIVERVA